MHYIWCMQDTEGIRYRYEALYPHLDEKGRRLFAAAEARTVGWGGIKLVSEITGIARSTIGRGLDELDGKTESPGEGRVRRRGGGRKLETQKRPSLLGTLESLVAPATRGDPERPLLWVSKSYRHLANGLSHSCSGTVPTAAATFMSRISSTVLMPLFAPTTACA